jgi:proteic killer suppression protein
MIQTFVGKETEKILEGQRSSKLPNVIQQICRRKLRMLNNAQTINDLRIPPSNRLKKMKGKFKQYHSIRINSQWRIKFIWTNNNAYEVEIIDYHE